MNRRELPQLGREPNSWPLGEPVTRPDGLVVRIMEDEGGYKVLTQGPISPNKNFRGQTFYTNKEITVIGEGNLSLGLVAAGQAAYVEDVLDKNKIGTPFDKLFEEIDPTIDI